MSSSPEESPIPPTPPSTAVIYEPLSRDDDSISLGDEAGSSISPNYEDADSNGAGDLESTITKLRALLAQRENAGNGTEGKSNAESNNGFDTRSQGKEQKKISLYALMKIIIDVLNQFHPKEKTSSMIWRPTTTWFVHL